MRRRVYAFTDDAGKTKPGMVRVMEGDGGQDYYLELWDMPVENFGRFILQVGLLVGLQMSPTAADHSTPGVATGAGASPSWHRHGEIGRRQPREGLHLRGVGGGGGAARLR